MNLIGNSPGWAFVLFAILLTIAAGQDGYRQRISNVLVIALLAAGIAVSVLSGVEKALWMNAAILIPILMVGSVAFSRGVLGGGDVKLLAATAFWFTPADLLVFLPAVAIAGGLLVVVWLPIRMARTNAGTRSTLRERTLPYGIAIALGGIVAGAIVRGLFG
ncbi:prepilin peptidase [Sphingomicrobium sp. XHP0239]|uniref:A24 family peptidase n=1 Tax=Sphingomicrobium maritimum TaxID=3133972 RepID=UPI0031CC3BE0